MSQLEDLLQQCTVKLTLPGRIGWGTGFFVAPGWILTCAHVVQEAKGKPVQVWWQRNDLEAVVERSLPDSYDLALLRVTLPTSTNPPCVYLDEDVRSRDPLYLFGYPDQDFPNGCPVTFNCEGLTGDEPALIKFALGQVRPGMSGSPLLNQRTGKVCGMVKFTRDRSIDLGGGAIPTRVILEQFPQLRELQREFHQRDRRWYDLVTTRAEIDFQPYLRSLIEDDDYREWQEFYTRTTVEDRKRSPQSKVTSRLKLRVETVKPERQSGQAESEPGQREQIEKWEVLDGLRKYAADHVLLVGRPGSGKSTSLERLLWEEASKALDHPDAQIPVLVKLRRCTSTIEELIQDFLSRHHLLLERAEIDRLLNRGKFLLLVDGLNELPEQFGAKAVNFRDKYRHTTPMIVSTRDLSVGGNLGIAKTLKMLPLTEPQMQDFVRGYLREGGDRLFQQIKGDRLRKFAETPLLLRMLCRVSAENGKVPANLGLTFREFAQLHDREIQADAPAESKDQWHKLLRHLAFALMQGEKPIDLRLSMPIEEAQDLLTYCLKQEDRANPRDCAEHWLKDLLDYHLLQPVVQPNFEEHIEFRHQLIQEYYAAEYLLRRLPTLSDKQLQRDYLNYLKWTEPFALMLALVEQEAPAVRVVQLAMDVDLMLGARLVGEMQPAFQPKPVGRITQSSLPPLLKIKVLGKTRSESAIAGLLQVLEDQDSGVRSSAAKALGKVGDEWAVLGLLQALEDQDSGVRRRAALALGKVGDERAVLGLLQALKDRHSGVRRNAAEALGEVGNERTVFGRLQTFKDQDSYVRRNAVMALGDGQAVLGLLQALKDQDSEVRRNAAEALGKVGDERAVPGLLQALKDRHSGARKNAAEALGKVGDGQAVLGLLQALKDRHSGVRRNAALALGKVGDERAVLGLLQALEDQNEDVRRIAAWALGKVGDESAVLGLLQALEHQDKDVCKTAAETLGKVGDERAVLGLLQALEHQNEDVRWNAAEALGKVGDERAVLGLLQALKDQDSGVRRIAAWALGKVGDERTVLGLLQALKDQDSGVRSSAAEALGKVGDERAVLGLLQALKDQTSYVRSSAAEALGEVGDERAVLGLLQALKDQTSYVRSRAAEALGKVGDERAVLGLLQALEDQDSGVRWRAAEALGKVGDERAVLGLLQALKHKDSGVRSSAAKALGKVGDERAVLGRLQALKDQDSYVRRRAAEALGKVGDERAVLGLLQALKDQDSYVRRIAAEALGKVGGEWAVPGLLQALKDRYYYVRRIAAWALRKVGGEWAVPGLLQALEDWHSDVRRSAAEALGKVGDERAVPGLLQALKDQNSGVRWRAAEALGKVGDERAVPGLLQALKDQNSGVRWRAVWALRKVGGERAVPGLLQALEDQDEDVRWNAARALRNVGSPIPIARLWQLCLMNRKELLEPIAAIQNHCQFYNYKVWQEAIQNKTDQPTQQITSESKNNFRGATFNAPVNFGDNPTGNFIGTQHNYAADPEVRGAIADLQTLLTQLQTQHPQVTTETQALNIIDAEFTEIKQSNNRNLATLRKQLLNPERHLQATKAALGEVAKHYLEESVWAKAGLAYLDKLSEAPNHGT